MKAVDQISRCVFSSMFLMCDLAAAAVSIAVHDQRAALEESPINRVVKLLGQMKTQLEKEAAADSEAYEKMSCWCDANDKLKNKAISDADTKISELQTIVESSSAQLAELATKVEHLKGELSEKKSALKQATALREQEYEAFTQEEKELVESITMLKNAIDVLSRHQAGLLQMTPAIQESLGSALRWVALRHEELLEMGVEGQRRLVKHRDGSTPALLSLASAGLATVKSKAATAEDIALVALRGGSAGKTGRVALPVEYAAQVLAHATTTTSSSSSPDASLVQQPAHLQPYAPQSGQIFGLLGHMKDDFEANLNTAQKDEQQAQAAYAELKSASEAQIEASTKLLDDLEAQRSSTQKALADAKEDLEGTRGQRGADVEFLSDLRLKCQALDQDWRQRTKARGEELKAVADAIAIITEDDARDIFHKKFASASAASFLQLSGSGRAVVAGRSDARGAGAAVSAAEVRGRASAALMKVARKLMAVAGPSLDDNEWAADARAWRAGEEKPHEQLATMAVQVKLDAFEKVKKAIDEMVVDLKAQQKQEVEGKANCTQEFNENEKLTYAANQELNDATERIANFEATIESLTEEIDTAHQDIASTEVELKKASEAREAENKDFQQEVMDQRTVQQILKKAIARLSSVYKAQTATLLQQDPNPPAQFQPYKQNSGGSNVISLLDSIVQDSAKLESEALASEQEAQKAYEKFAADSNDSIKMSNASIETKEKQRVEATADKQQAEADKSSAEGRLEDLGGYKSDLHMECDFLLKNFDIRQRARLQELEALQDAKAFLSGMADK